MDVEGRRYETLDDTLDYCYHVAGVVGVMMALVMGVRDEAERCAAPRTSASPSSSPTSPATWSRTRGSGACLPAARWLREAGDARRSCADPRHRAALAGVVARLLDEAERYYASATAGLERLPFRSAWAIAAARGVYREIGDVVLRPGRPAWDERAVVPRPARRWLGAGSARRCRRRRSAGSGGARRDGRCGRGGARRLASSARSGRSVVPGGLARVQEAERDRAVARQRPVVDEVRLHDALQVGVAGHVARAHAAVHDHVVEAEVRSAVRGHAQAEAASANGWPWVPR